MFIFNPLFTIFILLLGGYMAKKIGVLKQKQSKMFLDFAILFALPCLIFDKTYHLNFDFTLVTLILIGFLSCMLSAGFAVMLGRFLQFSKATLVSMFLLAGFGNTLFIGIPILSGIYGESFISEAIFYDALATAIPISIIGPFILSLASNQPTNFLSNLKRILLFPPFIALILGFVCKLFVLPDFIFQPIIIFGNSATAVALFSIGLGLGFSAIKASYKGTIIVVLSKTLLAPLIFVVSLSLLDIAFTPRVIADILESSMLTMTLAGAMIMKAKLDSNLAVSSIAFGILFSFVSIPLLCYLLPI